MHAVIEACGRQFVVRPGDRIQLEGNEHVPGDEVTFDKVLVMGEVLGTPTVQGAAVKGKVLSAGRGPKIYVQKYKRRKNYRRRTGFRASVFEVEITDMVGNN
jgi:large subunit ribosomal protein L21